MVADMYMEIITKENKARISDKMRWLNLHRCDVQLRKNKKKEEFSLLRIPLTCTNLDQDKDGKYFCKDYENRPILCRTFSCPKCENKEEKT